MFLMVMKPSPNSLRKTASSMLALYSIAVALPSWCRRQALAQHEAGPGRLMAAERPTESVSYRVMGVPAGYWLGSRGVGPIIRASIKALTAWDLLMLPVLALLVLAVHEAGHLAGGMSRGMRFLLFVAGPFGWVRSGEKIRFRWFFNLRSATRGAMRCRVSCCCRNCGADCRRPLSSLALALAALVAFGWCRDGSAYSLFVAGFSFAIFLLTAPFRAGGFMSDGMQPCSGGTGDGGARAPAGGGRAEHGGPSAELDAQRAKSPWRRAGVRLACLYSYAKALDNRHRVRRPVVDRIEACSTATRMAFDSLAEVALFEAPTARVQTGDGLVGADNGRSVAGAFWRRRPWLRCRAAIRSPGQHSQAPKPA
jgi:hypothetical protein